jgi:ABC-2 type transport system ATP-binding protein
MKKDSYFPYSLETHLVDHCNLKCKGCSHFAPLVDGEVFTDIEVFKRDFSRLKQLFEHIYEIRLMGGEPLLHPELLTFCHFIRNLYPNTNVSIYTNGILLLKMSDDFWKTCSENNILVKITYYPIDLRVAEIRRKAKENNVRLKIPKQIKHFFKHLNIDGDSDPKASFLNCRLMFQTPQLREGKLFPCFFPAYVHIFSQYFNQSLYASEDDYINIFDNINQADIIEFLDRPIPMCRWCVTRRSFTKWGSSEQNINEWIGHEVDFITHFFRKSKYRVINMYHQSKRSKIKTGK